MTRSPLEEAFAHHVWATLRLIDTCDTLTSDQLETAVPGTYGPIIDTMRHIVGADAWYLYALTGGSHARIEEAGMGLAELRDAMGHNGTAWTEVLRGTLDPDRIVAVKRDDGSEGRAPLGIRLAQVVHHGTDHRSQICTALTVMGVEPPAIDVWDYADGKGLYVDVPPPA